MQKINNSGVEAFGRRSNIRCGTAGTRPALDFNGKVHSTSLNLRSAILV
jgi:hypothetical protein